MKVFIHTQHLLVFIKKFCCSFSLNFESKQQVLRRIFDFIQGSHIYGPSLSRNLKHYTPLMNVWIESVDTGIT